MCQALCRAVDMHYLTKSRQVECLAVQDQANGSGSGGGFEPAWPAGFRAWLRNVGLKGILKNLSDGVPTMEQWVKNLTTAAWVTAEPPV